MTRLYILLLTILISACARGPDEAALKTDVQQRIDKSFKPGLLEVAALKRQGSSPLPAAQSGAERVLVYFNATLRTTRGLRLQGLGGQPSPATLARCWGDPQKERVRRQGEGEPPRRPAARLRAGSGAYTKRGQHVGLPALPRTRDICAEAPRSRQRGSESQLEALPRPAGGAGRHRSARNRRPSRQDHLRAGRPCAQSTGGARARRSCSPSKSPADGEYTRVVDAIIGTIAKRSKNVHVISVETEGSIENALLLGRGQADYGVVQSDVAWLAASGTGPFAADGPLAKIAALGSLYPGAGAHRGIREFGDSARGRPARQAGGPRHAAVGQPPQRAQYPAGAPHRLAAPRRGAGRRRAGRYCAAARRPHRRFLHHHRRPRASAAAARGRASDPPRAAVGCGPPTAW